MSVVLRCRPRREVVCSGCARPGGIEVVTRDAYPGWIAGLLVLVGVEPVRAWHAGCHAVHAPARTVATRLPAPFTGSWARLGQVLPTPDPTHPPTP